MSAELLHSFRELSPGRYTPHAVGRMGCRDDGAGKIPDYRKNRRRSDGNGLQSAAYAFPGNARAESDCRKAFERQGVRQAVRARGYPGAETAASKRSASR